MVIGRYEGGDIAPPRLAYIGQGNPSPGEGLLPQPDRQDIRHETGGATVAVRERMDGDETVMEPYRDLVRRISLVLDPVAGIVQSRARFDWNTDRIDPKIALGPAKSTGPGPDIAKHPAVKLLDELSREDVSAALAVCPCNTRRNVGLLSLVQIASVSDPTLEKTDPFLGLKRCSAVGRVEQIAHDRSQRSRSLRCSRTRLIHRTRR